MHFQISLTSEHAAGFGGVPFSGDCWRKEEERNNSGKT